MLACAPLSFATYALAGEADLNLVCIGNSYKQDGAFPTAETFSFKTEGKKPVMIGGLVWKSPLRRASAQTTRSN